jgi:FHA domain/WXG100 protein secretion system (Wss), protein YukD
MIEAGHLLHVTVVSALGQLMLDLPADEPVARLLPELLAATGLCPSPAAARADEWQLAATDGPVLAADRTLAEQGINPGTSLHLRGVSVTRRAWTAVVRADRRSFESAIQANGAQADPSQLPPRWPERHIPLTGTQMQIGRGSTSRGNEPDIDLSGPPPDTGVSHQHTVLVAEPDGTWALIDQGSSNGTLLNAVEVTPGQRTPLHDGDQISLGRWTVLTIRLE